MSITKNKYLFVGAGLGVLVVLIIALVALKDPAPEAGVTSPVVQQTIEPGPRTMFTEVSAVKGMSHLMPTWGVSWNDYNADGRPDLFVADHMHFPSAMFTNVAGLWFDKDVELGYQVDLDDHQTVWGDYNGNGKQDFFITTGFYRPKHLFQNLGGGRFDDVAEQAGLREGHTGSGRSGLMVDFNANGWLDVAAFNTGTADSIYFNRGDGTFEDATLQSRIVNSFGKDGGMAGDLDGDGDIDVLIITYGGILLYLNRGDGSFVERSESAGLVFERAGPRTGALGDYDNDGDLDLYFSRGVPEDLLLQNQGDATFVDVTAEAGITASGEGFRTAAFADVNNDGWQDIYVVWGGTDKEGNEANTLYLNGGDGTFTDITDASSTAGKVLGNAVTSAFADFNDDGFLDMAISHGLGVHLTSGPVLLFRNEGLQQPDEEHCGNWINVQTDKRHGSRDGYGAVVRVLLPDGRTLVRQAATAQRPLAQDAPGVHIGLGCAPHVARISVTWPDGSSAHLDQLPVNGHVLVEADKPSRRIQTHPAALLGQIPYRDDAFFAAAERIVPQAGSAVSARPGDLRRRQDEVLAHALITELVAGITVSDDEVRQYYDQNRQQFSVPERWWLDHVLVGVFTPRKKQPRLPWAIAKKVVKMLSDEKTTAYDAARKVNVLAWSVPKRNVGRYWDIEGETRGYSESGWMTRQMLEERFDAELVTRLLHKSLGKVIGPVKRKETFTVQDREGIPQTLNIYKLTRHEPERLTEIEPHRADIRRSLLRRKLSELVGDAIISERVGHYAWFGGLRYDVDTLADRARALGLQERPEVRIALERCAREAALDERIRALLDDATITGTEIGQHMQERALAWTQKDLLKLRHVYIADREDAEKALAMVKGGMSFDEMQEKMNISDLNTRKGRGSKWYFEDTLLNQRTGALLIEEKGFRQLQNLETGAIAPIIERGDQFHLFRLDERLTDRAGDDSMQAVAERELRRQREADLMTRLHPLASNRPSPG